MKKQWAVCGLWLALGLQAQTVAISTVRNTASGSSMVSPGGLVSVFGEGFGETSDGISVWVGGLSAHVQFVSSGQINVQLPYGIAIGPAELQVNVKGGTAAASVTISTYAPALLTLDGSGDGAGIFVNKFGLLPRNGGVAAGEAVTAYATGLGPTKPSSVLGGTPGGAPCAVTPAVTVDGAPAAVNFCRLSSRLAGVYEVNFVTPAAGAGLGEVVLSIGGINSTGVRLPRVSVGQTAGIAIRSGGQRAYSPGSPIELVATRPESGVAVSTPQAATGSGISYTCDPTINAVAGVCNTLNTTIAALYSHAFKNANASIYVTFGISGLGSSDFTTNLSSYGTFRNALIAVAADASQMTADTDSVPGTNPLSSGMVEMTNATYRALGFTPASGLKPNGNFCTLGSTGCYDGIITLSNSVQTAGQFYYRTGTITRVQYDFYSVTEHETDEILGTASCAPGFNDDCGGDIDPADLFRYHSNGSRSFAIGDNNSCASPDTGNACFSLDAVHMLQQYNNLDPTEDAGDWLPNCAMPLVQDAASCPGVANLDISPSAEILLLNVVGFATQPAAPALAISKSHSGNFTQGQTGRTYTLLVSNGAFAASTNGTATVTETVPTGLTLVSMAGTGWTCPAGNTCTRSDALSPGSSYPPITVTVNVAITAPASVTNQATVSGGGSAAANASDVTTIVPSTMSLSQTILNFASGGGVITDPQSVTVSFSAGARLAWTASSNQANVHVSPASGTGLGVLQITASAGPSATVTVTAPSAPNSPLTIQVNLATVTPGAPFGSFDTPLNGATGVSGSIAVTGWALDSIEVTGVDIWREPVAGEPASPSLILIGNATFVPGARPDVQALYPSTPFNYQAGWGYLLLTNELPNNGVAGGIGNGTYKLHAIAHNKTGSSLDLGTKTITVNNAAATLPFGAIDTPGQGATVSGTVTNFGWALTPPIVGCPAANQPCIIPVNGSTIFVYVDGASLGSPVYNLARCDVDQLFPGYANSGSTNCALNGTSPGPVGYFNLDTTQLTDGVHTLAWSVTDNAGRAQGIGSRYFTVEN